MANRILPDRDIEDLIYFGNIEADHGVPPGAIQPSSLDLACSDFCVQVRTTALPTASTTVAELLDETRRVTLDGAQKVLLPHRSYVVRLAERLSLPDDVAASANPKSSTGRLDVHCRLIADRTPRYDEVPAGYDGPLYLEITPRSFPVLLRPGVTLCQIRFYRPGPVFDLETWLGRNPDVRLASSTPLIRDNAITLSAHFPPPDDADAIVAYRALTDAPVVDLQAIGGHRWQDYWVPIHASAARDGLVIERDQFYIVASHERIQTPPGLAAEMVDIDTRLGGFNSHYAGYVDPGFGMTPSGEPGARAVLEIRNHEAPFLIRHGQDVCRMRYTPMAAPPRQLYGGGPAPSHYVGQDLKLAKHFA